MNTWLAVMPSMETQACSPPLPWHPCQNCNAAAQSFFWRSHKSLPQCGIVTVLHCARQMVNLQKFTYAFQENTPTVRRFGRNRITSCSFTCPHPSLQLSTTALTPVKVGHYMHDTNVIPTVLHREESESAGPHLRFQVHPHHCQCQ